MQIYEYKTILAGDGRNILAREREQTYGGTERIVSPQDTVQIMRDVFRLHECAEEYVWLVCLDNGGKPAGFFEVSHGTCSYAPAQPREILVRALLCGASCIILAHNHPGRDPAPSGEDRRLTERIREASGLVGIRFLDHVIIGGSCFYSFRKEEPWEETDEMKGEKQ